MAPHTSRYYLEHIDYCCLCGGLVFTISESDDEVECIDCKTRFKLED